MRVHVYVSGIVQGVFFRDFTQRQAERNSVGGWVRNLRDGRVEAVAEGDAGSIERWLAELRQGPPSGRVDNVEVTRNEPEEGLGGFEVRY
jgi:acylphosphatase